MMPLHESSAVVDIRLTRSSAPRRCITLGRSALEICLDASGLVDLPCPRDAVCENPPETLGAAEFKFVWPLGRRRERNRMRKIVLAMMLAGTATPSVASNWVHVGWNNQTTIYADFESVRSLPNHLRKAWIKTVFKDVSDGRVSSLMLLYFNCVQNTAAGKSRTFYLADGATAGPSKEVPDDQLHFTPYPPDTMGEWTLEKVCKAPITH